MKKGFDYCWKVALIVLLILGMILMLIQVRNISREGLECKSQPFIYGARKMTERQGVEHMFCNCYLKGEDYFKTYTFDENVENPDA